MSRAPAIESPGRKCREQCSNRVSPLQRIALRKKRVSENKHVQAERTTRARIFNSCEERSALDLDPDCDWCSPWCMGRLRLLLVQQGQHARQLRKMPEFEGLPHVRRMVVS